MTLTIDDIVTHYILSSHPKNKAIVDIKEKTTGELRYIKIRHRLSKIYAASLVDPVSFEVWAETQAKSATAKIKPIVLHLDSNDTKADTPVEFRDTSRLGFEWTFTWEGEKYRWVRESRMSNTLECKAIRKSGDICVAQYLPRMLKDEYFGIFSLLGYNILRCKLTKSRELELLLLMSLMTLLDKSNDGSWKKEWATQGAQDDVGNDPIPKASQKKSKKELLNDQKLQLLLEKDVKRSQKQIQTDQKQFMTSLSADNTPKTSPLPTPSTSATHVSRQKSISMEPKYLPEPSSQRHDQQLKKQRSYKQFDLDAAYYHDHQLSLPIAYATQQYENPPSLQSIRWNQEQPYYPPRSNNVRKTRLPDDGRRFSASEYAYQSQQNYRYSTEYYLPPYQQPFDYY